MARRQRHRTDDEPVSLTPLDPEDALRALLQVTPDQPVPLKGGQHWRDSSGDVIVLKAATVNRQMWSAFVVKTGALVPLSEDYIRDNYDLVDDDPATS